MQHHIFLSYSRKDSTVMQRVREDLRKVGMKVWTDDGIEPGTPSWKRVIEEAIINTACLVCILSPDAARSRWVRAELDFAETQGKPIFLILARGDERTAVPFGFTTFQWVDIRQTNNYRPNMKTLIRSIRKKIGSWELETDGELSTSENELVRTHVSTPGAGSYAPPMLSPVFLPEPFDWCDVPEGQVRIDFEDRRGSQNYHLPAFFIAKYLVTNAQYQIFLDDRNGYPNAIWWEFSNAALDWHKSHPKPGETGFAGDELPRTNVSWFDAMAFCRWLTYRLHASKQLIGMEITLPTEQQWQRAAQGDDGRGYPWGERFDKAKCNILGSGIGRPTPVKKYAGGASPFGAQDMAGNVWEWSLSEYDRESIDLQSKGNRVLRGGAYHFMLDLSGANFRGYSPPNGMREDIGFRLVCVITGS